MEKRVELPKELPVAVRSARHRGWIHFMFCPLKVILDKVKSKRAPALDVIAAGLLDFGVSFSGENLTRNLGFPLFLVSKAQQSKCSNCP
jgi:hypothetical protein